MKDSRAGALFALGAYGLWGVVPIYWKRLGPVPAVEVVAHRVVWSVLFVAVVLTVTRGWASVLAAVRSRRTLAYLSASTALIAANWGLFIWAVQTGHILQASLGYFINPLVNVAAGVLFLKERLSRPQVIAVTLATIGVLVLTLAGGTFPWVSLTLAFSFAAYALLRKTAPVESLAGLFIETLLVAPLALALIVWRERGGHGALGAGSFAHGVMLSMAGPITAIPLLMFAAAARRMPLSTLGFFQYLSPTLQFVLAVALYGERLTPAHVVTFGFIWAALAVFSLARSGRT